MAKNEEIIFIVLHERIRFANTDGPDTTLLECQQDGAGLELTGDKVSVRTTIKVKCDPGDLVIDLPYRFSGHWKDTKYGRQFHASSFRSVQPHSMQGVVKYLMQAPGIGRVKALALWNEFKSEAVQVLRLKPDVAGDVACMTAARANKAAAFLNERTALEATTIDLIDLLAGRGFPKSTGKSVVEEWGIRAIDLIRKNPYLLMRFPRCSFGLVDPVYLDLGGDPAKIKRQALCAVYSIARDNNGHTWHRPKILEKGLQEMIAGADVQPVKAAKLAVRAGLLAVRHDGGTWFADAKKASSEATVAECVRGMLIREPQWPSIDSLDVSEHQRENLTQSLAGPLSIFTGGPGTGKTYATARLVAEIQRMDGEGMVAVAAPTGKAAVRITEAMAEYEIRLRAMTIHSLLKVESQSEGGGWRFSHNEENPLPYRFIVIDEASMIDADLAAAFFRACGPSTHVLLVGDTGQLAPVSHGRPLYDLIAAGVSCGELTEMQRNSGAIVKACHQIRVGKQFRIYKIAQPDKGENLVLLNTSNAGGTIDRVVKALQRVKTLKIADPIWDCQVIVAVNERSELSRHAVNKRLQRELNPGGQQADGNPFRVGDKIVCLKNGYLPVVEDAPAGFNCKSLPRPMWIPDEDAPEFDAPYIEDMEEREQVEEQLYSAELNRLLKSDTRKQTEYDAWKQSISTAILLDGKVRVANGEVAAVKMVEPKLTIAQLDSPARLVKIPRGKSDSKDATDTGCSWDLAYALSCHKMQGNEVPIVFVMLDDYPGAKMVCSREWLYTAMSRAKVVCFLVGKLGTAYGMIGREAIRQRKTFLKELIQGEGTL